MRESRRKNKIESLNHFQSKGCGKTFCMDCGKDGAKDKSLHNLGCTMGDVGWMPCGEEYDGDIMLCSGCDNQKCTNPMDDWGKEPDHPRNKTLGDSTK